MKNLKLEKKSEESIILSGDGLTVDLDHNGFSWINDFINISHKIFLSVIGGELYLQPYNTDRELVMVSTNSIINFDGVEKDTVFEINYDDYIPLLVKVLTI